MQRFERAAEIYAQRPAGSTTARRDCQLQAGAGALSQRRLDARARRPRHAVAPGRPVGRTRTTCWGSACATAPDRRGHRSARKGRQPRPGLLAGPRRARRALRARSAGTPTSSSSWRRLADARSRPRRAAGRRRPGPGAGRPRRTRRADARQRARPYAGPAAVYRALGQVWLDRGAGAQRPRRLEQGARGAGARRLESCGDRAMSSRCTGARCSSTGKSMPPSARCSRPRTRYPLEPASLVLYATAAERQWPPRRRAPGADRLRRRW